jgi:protocatechuate 3,4-dioxygenase beta subunit
VAGRTGTALDLLVEERRLIMAHRSHPTTRRGFLRQTAVATTAVALHLFDTPGLFAEQLALTPRQTQGPFYPDRLPLDTDNDLVIVSNALTPAVGQVTHLTGRLLTPSGSPISNALIEIWQVDATGAYIHTRSAGSRNRDLNFQGFGRFATGSTGEYYFRTIKPVAYSDRAPHIHVAVKTKGRDEWTTQCYVKGEMRNGIDGVLNRIRDPKARASVIVDFVPRSGSAIGELNARFDIVLGFTPQG